jgi:Sigma-70 region 2.
MGSTDDRGEEAIARLIAGIVKGCVRQLPGYAGAASLREDLIQEGQRAAWEARSRYRPEHTSGAS